jgi:hypothetical protein
LTPANRLGVPRIDRTLANPDKRLHQIAGLAGRDAVLTGFHHHGEQRLVDPVAVFQPGGEERVPARSFGIVNPSPPAVVANTPGRVPLRWVVRSVVPSSGAAPMNALAYLSISSG